MRPLFILPACLLSSLLLLIIFTVTAKAQQAFTLPHEDHPEADTPLLELIQDAYQPFTDIETADLDGLLSRIGDARVVLLGEASHGTREFYQMRERITRELIEKKGFNVIAIEGDWPDASRIDFYLSSN